MSSTVTSGPTQRSGERRTTLATLAKMARQGEPFAALTCYDATTARHLAAAGLHLLLVGDTAAEVVLGLPRTIDMDLDVLLALTAGVKRGCGAASVVMGDMPFMSYQAGQDDALRNAGRFLTKGLADIVKIEADHTFAPLIDRMVRAGIPVCAHVGSRPQRAAVTGGYTAAGRTPGEADAVVRDALALEGAGCSMLLIEAVPDEVTDRVLQKTSVPLIGIGAGPACHGQVLVLTDLLGLSPRPPTFARPTADLSAPLQSAAASWVELVRTRATGPSPYTMKPAH
ncbi:MAG: 3-methyl-2-oxobutanoate hydroxymethyltransferase [Phycisphaerales bacterium]